MSPNPLDWFLWLAGGLGTMFAATLGIIKRNRDRSLENQRRLEGDDHADGYEGLMGISRDTRQRVTLLEEKIDQARRERKHEHEQVMDRLEAIEE